MTAIIISGHGMISEGLLSAFEMIYGKDSQVVNVVFKKGEGVEDLKQRYEEGVSLLKEATGILFMVDIYGGSPYNAAAQYAFGKDNMEIVTGTNLPMLLEAASLKDKYSPQELANQLKVIYQQGFHIFSEEIKKIDESNENEEEL